MSPMRKNVETGIMLENRRWKGTRPQVLRSLQVLVRVGPPLLISFLILVMLFNMVLPQYFPGTLTFQAPLLLFVMDTLFSGTALALAVIILRGYLAGGSTNLLFFGCGMLSLSLASFIAGVLGAQAANASNTIHNTGVLLSSAFQFQGSLSLFVKQSSRRDRDKKKKTVAIFAFVAIFVFFAGLSFATLYGYTPPFRVPASGPTLLREFVLIAATILFGASCLLIVIFDRERRSFFLSFCAVALGLITVSLIAFITNKQTNSPLSWVGRSAQYAAGIYLLAAFIAAVRTAMANRWGVPDAVADFFRPSEVLYRDLVETVTDAIIPVGTSGEIFLWSTVAEQMFGYNQMEASGLALSDLIDPEATERVIQEIRAGLLDERGPFFGKPRELKARRKAGGEFPAELSSSSRRVGDRWISTLVIRDITERKRAEEEIRKLNEDLAKRAHELEMVNKELDTFDSMVAHELKNHFVVIGALAGRLSKGLAEKLDAKGQEYLAMLNDSVGNMITLVNDLLELSRVSKTKMKFEKVDLSELAWLIIKKFREKDRDRQVELVMPKGMEVEGDRRLLGVALDNLLGNAWKFTKNSDPARIELGVRRENEGQVFYVRDNGCGFEMPEDPEKAFSLFQRFHSTDQYPGSGVGLTTVKRILDRHGGKIRVESEVGKGTTFYFSIGDVSN